ncbi:MAG: hypothetical protein LUJ09_05130 [Firmicutes bacterium]|nr:hypothetical protein [Bacillota bacterium]
MAKQLRTTAFLTALAVLLAMLFSAGYIIGNADHDCIGEDCAQCAQIAMCESTLRCLSTFLLLAAAAIFARICFAAAVVPIRPFSVPDTLISLKVKQSN